MLFSHACLASHQPRANSPLANSACLRASQAPSRSRIHRVKSKEIPWLLFTRIPQPVLASHARDLLFSHTTLCVPLHVLASHNPCGIACQASTKGGFLGTGIRVPCNRNSHAVGACFARIAPHSANSAQPLRIPATTKRKVELAFAWE